MTLDHVQRINIVALLDMLECKGRRDAWAVCKLQERIDLDETERQAIGLQSDRTPEGREFLRWDITKTLEPRTYDLNEEDVNRICRALDSVPLILARDRWYRTLQAQLPEPAESNGHATPAPATGES